MSSLSNYVDLSLSLHPFHSESSENCNDTASGFISGFVPASQGDIQQQNGSSNLRSVGEHVFHSNYSTSTDGQQQQQQQIRRAHKVLTDEEREQAIDLLLATQQDLKLPRGFLQKSAANFGVSRWTMERLWKSLKYLIITKQKIKIRCKFKEKCGRKKLELDYDQLSRLPLKRRTTVRALASALNMSKSTVHRFIKWGKIKRHSNAMKPALTPLNKLQRLRWCVQNVIPQSIRTIPRFIDMYNMVHVDEKWFFMSKATHNFYLAPNELKPYRTCKSKRYINKLMFVTAVSRPWFSEEGDEIFDGKIGVFPLTYKVAAQRSSVNRAAGTMETKAIPKITQQVIRQVFINQLIHAIKCKWPIDACGTIWVQQDNATPHMSMTDQAFNEAGNTDGFHIHLLPQPPNSPDMNVLDLGFFRAIQAIQQQHMPTTIDELVDAVQHAFDVFDSKLLNYVFLSYQYCMLECMKVNGSNNYNIPHVNKAKMEREGTLPTSVEVPMDLLSHCATEMVRQFLSITEPQHNEGLGRGEHVNNGANTYSENELCHAIEAYYRDPRYDTENDEEVDQEAHADNQIATMDLLNSISSNTQMGVTTHYEAETVNMLQFFG